mmetsp:Transcript_14071/g.30565  ORF Transcript_14071/g.30565 Transcript_14071/m.30565 type:complete len:93 (+) Transcript_14071:445-723(+)
MMQLTGSTSTAASAILVEAVIPSLCIIQTLELRCAKKVGLLQVLFESVRMNNRDRNLTCVHVLSSMLLAHEVDRGIDSIEVNASSSTDGEFS